MKEKEIIEIKNILRNIGREDLLSEYLYQKNFQEVKTILEMEEWKD